MIPLTEINDAVKKYQVSADTIEKDYVISWILCCLSKSKIKDKFIFYGGTAIKRIYFESHRFSEDIDLLSSEYFDQDYLLQELNILKMAREEVNLILDIDPSTVIARKNRIQLLVNYSGYDEIIGVPKEIRLDFVMNMDLYGQVHDNKMIASYSDLQSRDTRLSVMSLNTIFANKLGLLIDSTRNEPRDLFDIWFLLQRQGEFKLNFEEICTAFKEKYGFQPTLNSLRSGLNKKSLKNTWEARLRKQVAQIQDIGNVICDVEEDLKILFKGYAKT